MFVSIQEDHDRADHRYRIKYRLSFMKFHSSYNKTHQRGSVSMTLDWLFACHRLLITYIIQSNVKNVGIIGIVSITTKWSCEVIMIQVYTRILHYIASILTFLHRLQESKKNQSFTVFAGHSWHGSVISQFLYEKSQFPRLSGMICSCALPIVNRHNRIKSWKSSIPITLFLSSCIHERFTQYIR